MSRGCVNFRECTKYVCFCFDFQVSKQQLSANLKFPAAMSYRQSKFTQPLDIEFDQIRISNWCLSPHLVHKHFMYNEVKCDQKVEYGTRKSSIVKISQLLIQPDKNTGKTYQCGLWRRRMELSTVPLSVFVPGRPSFALWVDFSAACKQKKKHYRLPVFLFYFTQELCFNYNFFSWKITK